MGMLALVFGLIGGLCMVMGIITAFDVVPQFNDAFGMMTWFALSALMLLISIAFSVGRSENY